MGNWYYSIQISLPPKTTESFDKTVIDITEHGSCLSTAVLGLFVLLWLEWIQTKPLKYRCTQLICLFLTQIRCRCLFLCLFLKTQNTIMHHKYNFPLCLPQSFPQVLITSPSRMSDLPWSKIYFRTEGKREIDVPLFFFPF